MLPVRDKCPVRRQVPTKSPKKNWSLHKNDLQEDFNCSCAYCDAHDSFRHTFYEVDHFIPKVFFEPLGNITLTQYDNLVYSCKFCNNSKRAMWPSKSEKIHHLNNEGFVDPCTAEYDSHFHRNSDGAILGTTALGKWMATKAFKFDEREHAIKLLWTLKNLKATLDDLQLVLNSYLEGSESYAEIKKKRDEFAGTYFEYHSQLIEYYNG
jgi:5-methylcytosine-specific restriction endonuclease McrA